MSQLVRHVALLIAALALLSAVQAETARADDSVVTSVPGAIVVSAGESDNRLSFSYGIADDDQVLIDSFSYLGHVLSKETFYKVVGGVITIVVAEYLVNDAVTSQGNYVVRLRDIPWPWTLAAPLSGLLVLRGALQTAAVATLAYPIVLPIWKLLTSQNVLLMADFGAGRIATQQLCYRPRLTSGSTAPTSTIACPLIDDPVTGRPPTLTVLGNGGNDKIGLSQVHCARLSAVTAIGGAGDDDLRGSKCADTLIGQSGRDEIWGDDGDDSLFGGDFGPAAGPISGPDDDRLYGNQGRDFIGGDAGNDLVSGGSGNDSRTISLNPAQDGIPDQAWEGLHGGPGDDTVIGGAGLDALYGDAGRDTLVSDELLGGDSREADLAVDCGPGTSGPQFHLESPGDPIAACDQRLGYPISFDALTRLPAGAPWPWF